MAYYATEAGIQTGHGWKTPFPAEKVRGSVVGYWILYLLGQVNPLTGENYSSEYNRIGIDVEGANRFIDQAVAGKEYSVKGFAATDADERAANRWIRDRRFFNAANGGEPYEKLQKMGVRAIPALCKNLLDRKSDVESRKWSIKLLDEMATEETVPWIYWAIDTFQGAIQEDPAADPREQWLDTDVAKPAIRKLERRFNNVKPLKPPFLAEQAMAGALDPAREAPQDLGGIDMNASALDMQIRRDGNGMALPVEEQDLERIRIQGLVPVILFIQPAVNMPLFSDAGPPEPSRV